jgi:hypothetical protein
VNNAAVVCRNMTIILNPTLSIGREYSRNIYIGMLDAAHKEPVQAAIKESQSNYETETLRGGCPLSAAVTDIKVVQ